MVLSVNVKFYSKLFYIIESVQVEVNELYYLIKLS